MSPTRSEAPIASLVELDRPETWAHLVPPSVEALPAGALSNAAVYTRPDPERTRVMRWPNSPWIREQEPSHYFDIFEDHFFSVAPRFLERSTPIGSIGSCFATRIAHQLQLWGYNYVIEEDDLPPGIPLAQLASTQYRTAPARCGTLFDTPSMRQVVERGFGEWSPPGLVTRRGDRLIDPFRTVTLPYATLTEYEADQRRHGEALGRALKRCDVMILTLGLTEAWQYLPTGDYVSTPQLDHAPSLFRRRQLSVEDNVQELERISSVYARHKPDIKLIVSVSPVPLNKTFTRDHVVVANCLSKSILRVAAEEFVARHPGTAFYFPSYESVLYGTRAPWETDMRHVSGDAVARVMALFQRMFLAEQASLPVAPHAPAHTPSSWTARWVRLLRRLSG